jgi:thiosulfate dehydrogenase [quinone] large subunit
MEDTMALHHADRPTRTATTPDAGAPTTTARLLAALRITMGLVFLWAFLDKLFGFGYATGATNAWMSGGSPTRGFLGGIDHGPMGGMFRSWAGQGWADWLFMAGLLGVGAALLLGVGLRVAAVAGSLQMLLMWAAEWPLARHTDAGELTRSTNPLLDYHIVYVLVLIVIAAACAGNVWGLGGRWARLDVVTRNPWLR